MFFSNVIRSHLSNNMKYIASLYGDKTNLRLYHPPLSSLIKELIESHFIMLKSTIKIV